MSDNVTEGQQDLFDDSTPDTGGEASISATNLENDASEQVTEKVTEVDKEVQEESQNQTGDKKADGTPPEGEEELEVVTDKTGKKLIPEHRFKAALKKVTDELEAKNAKLAEYEKPEAAPVPDKETDPEGYALHMRMDASKTIMMDLVPDYQEKINHFAVMAESNPLLNQAVASHPIPAKLAYDIAKKDLEIKEALAIKDSEDWKAFQEFKKAKKVEIVDDQQTTLANTVKKGLRAVPNLNRSTNASPNRNVRKTSTGDYDDDLFKGAL